MMSRQDTRNLFLAQLNSLQLYVATVYTEYSLQIVRQGQSYNAVILPTSFEYWRKRYHLAQHPPELIICYEHDTCVNVAVFSLKTCTLYDPCETIHGKQEDFSDRATKKGKQRLLGALLCGLRIASETIERVPRATRYRYYHDLKLLRRRKQGRPVQGVPKKPVAV